MTLTLKDPTFCQAALVGGGWIEADPSNAIKVDNPATGEIIGLVPNLGAAETKKAVAPPRPRRRNGPPVPGKERSGILRRWYELMRENQDDLGHIRTAGHPSAATRFPASATRAHTTASEFTEIK